MHTKTVEVRLKPYPDFQFQRQAEKKYRLVLGCFLNA